MASEYTGPDARVLAPVLNFLDVRRFPISHVAAFLKAFYCLALMPACEHPAVLIITQQVVDTSTSVARDRYQLRCDLEAGHDGPHHDSRHHESWEGIEGQHTTLLRHEGEKADTPEPQRK